MSDGIYIAASGAIARQAHLETVSHNLANVDTPGYRARKVRFEAMLAAQGGQPQVRAVQDGIQMTAGHVDATENPFDLSIAGDGFFVVQTPQGLGVTRAGNFQTDTQGHLVTPEGNRVLNPSGQPIIVPPSVDFLVDELGNIWDDFGMVDQIDLVTVENPENLVAIGPSTFAANPAALRASAAMIQQGNLEKSNVNAVESMTELVMLQRHFEAMQKLIQTFHTIDNRAVRSVGSVAG